MLGGDEDLIRYTKPGVQFHLHYGRWCQRVVMGFYHGASEYPQRGHQKSKVRSKAH